MIYMHSGEILDYTQENKVLYYRHELMPHISLIFFYVYVFIREFNNWHTKAQIAVAYGILVQYTCFNLYVNFTDVVKMFYLVCSGFGDSLHPAHSDLLNIMH